MPSHNSRLICLVILCIKNIRDIYFVRPSSDHRTSHFKKFVIVDFHESQLLEVHYIIVTKYLRAYFFTYRSMLV